MSEHRQLAATLTTDEVYQAFLGAYEEFKTFFHGHSYTGNPLGCAVALANSQPTDTPSPQDGAVPEKEVRGKPKRKIDKSVLK